MVGKRNRILQTEKHQDTGGDHVCEMRFLAKKYVFQKKMKFSERQFFIWAELPKMKANMPSRLLKLCSNTPQPQKEIRMLF